MNEENLKPFKPGQSGNPKGKPKGAKNVSTILREMLQNLAPDLVVDKDFIKQFCKTLKGKARKQITNADAQAARILYEALVNGEQWAIKELLDRTEGKARQTVELGGADGGPIRFTVDLNGDSNT